ncbi:MAG: hypothetical protein ACE5EC_03305 [Phycisphaerae bacterium]
MPDPPETLALTAITLGFLHTLAGPDHYLPFVAMSRARHWTLAKTLAITLICGIGHVLSSVIIGLVGIGFGLGLDRLERIESTRGDWAAWLLVGFGLMYCVWGLRRAARNRPHTHLHAHADGTIHRHEHVHEADHLHVHDARGAPRTDKRDSDAGISTHPHPHSANETASITPWILFTIFLFGPCEVLIPLVLYPAAHGSPADVVWVTGLFGITTLATMAGIVSAACLGMGYLRVRPLERFGHALAGFAVLTCGVGILFGL